MPDEDPLRSHVPELGLADSSPPHAQKRSQGLRGQQLLPQPRWRAHHLVLHDGPEQALGILRSSATCHSSSLPARPRVATPAESCSGRKVTVKRMDPNGLDGHGWGMWLEFMCGATHALLSNSVGSQSQSTTVYTSMLPDDCPASTSPTGLAATATAISSTSPSASARPMTTPPVTTPPAAVADVTVEHARDRVHTNWDTQWQGDHLGDWHFGGDVFTNGGGYYDNVHASPMDLTNPLRRLARRGLVEHAPRRFPRALGLDLQRRAPPSDDPV